MRCHAGVDLLRKRCALALHQSTRNLVLAR
jgi:hypothetical protein